jgi:hypothetical protein
VLARLKSFFEVVLDIDGLLRHWGYQQLQRWQKFNVAQDTLVR